MEDIRSSSCSALCQQFPDTDVRKRPPAPGRRVWSVCVKNSAAFSGHLEILISVIWNTNESICASERKIGFRGRDGSILVISVFLWYHFVRRQRRSKN